MRPSRKFTATLCLVAVTLTTIVPPQVFAGGWPFGPTTSVERLAGSIDRIERHLDQYGTVVTKDPDVWGQARLTKYRREYEDVMASQQGKFASTVNASISRSDQAFVTNALAIQAAISGQRASIFGPPTTTTTTQTPTFVPGLTTPPVDLSYNNVQLQLPPQAIQVPAFDADGNPIYATATSSKASNEVKPLDTPTASAEKLITSPGFGSPSQQAQALAFEQQKIALEPTVMLDQMSRYLNHLHELRRISDGDDKSDAPGYALHLVRLPVSVLPGKKTRMGYGAEVSVIAKPHLHEQLLQDTFRGLVINDLVDQWSFPLAKFIDRSDAKTVLEKVGKGTFSKEQKEQLEKLTTQLVSKLEQLEDSKISVGKLVELLENAEQLARTLVALIHEAKVSSPELVSLASQVECSVSLSLANAMIGKEKAQRDLAKSLEWSFEDAGPLIERLKVPSMTPNEDSEQQ